MLLLFTRGAGHTEPGKPHVAQQKDQHGNNAVRPVPCLGACAKHFANHDAIDVQNQSRWFDLKLEKHQVTQRECFCIITTLVGMTVTDCWHACPCPHRPDGHAHKKITMRVHKHPCQRSFEQQLFCSKASRHDAHHWSGWHQQACHLEHHQNRNRKWPR